MRNSAYTLGVCSVAMGVFCLTLLSRPVQAEMYVAGEAGVNSTHNFNNVEFSAGGLTVGGNDLILQNSVMYRAKLGYYFESLKWLGVETEVFNATPHIGEPISSGATMTLHEAVPPRISGP